MKDAAHKLRIHRQSLARNPAAYETDLSRVRNSVVPHLKRAGFARVTRARCGDLIDRFVDLIFETQDRRPFFHLEGTLPFCWNAPKHWDKDFILYEWGHLHSRNQNPGADSVVNLCMQSARCNQHIQTSMNIDEVMDWLDGSAVAARARTVLERRARLFESAAWRELHRALDKFR